MPDGFGFLFREYAAPHTVPWSPTAHNHRAKVQKIYECGKFP